jgi:ABC-type dipeptide/oligopeptide/nickel transport system ATPase component
MLQRASIAAAVAHDPPLTIADEPTSALDHALKARILAALSAKCRAMLLITHDFSVIANHVDRVLVCAEGMIVESGAPATVMARPQHAVTRSLLNAAAPYLKAANA